MGQVQEIADRLFFVFQSVSPCDRPGLRREQSAQDRERLVDAGLKRLYAEAAAEREKHRLGVLGRARVAFHLQQKMIAAGYPPLLVRQVLFAMLASAFTGRSS